MIEAKNDWLFEVVCVSLQFSAEDLAGAPCHFPEQNTHYDAVLSP
jgi:hypothetical protein